MVRLASSLLLLLSLDSIEMRGARRRFSRSSKMFGRPAPPPPRSPLRHPTSPPPTTTTAPPPPPPTTTTESHQLSCTFPDHYCNPTAPSLIRKVEDVEIEDAGHCKDLCADQSGCEDFTYFNFRGIKTCYLLNDCSDKRPKCTVPSSCVSGKVSCSDRKMCHMLSSHDIEQHMRWRCQGGINPYEEDIPAGTPCYTYCPSWVNQDGENFVVKSICIGSGSWEGTRHAVGINNASEWGEPKYFPPGVPVRPEAAQLTKPPNPIDQCTCSDLRLPYNPNTREERSAMFYCDREINWADITDPALNGVRITTNDRCHLFCDKMLISITECKEGVWTGRPDLGYWCNMEPTGEGMDVTNWDEAHGPVIIKRSHKPRVSEQRAKPLMWHSDYHLPDNHHYNNNYDGGYDDNVNGDP